LDKIITMEDIIKLNSLVDDLLRHVDTLKQDKEVLQKKISILLDKNDELDRKNKDMILQINKILSVNLNNVNQ